MAKLPINELTRLAFLGAEQDSRALAEAWPSDTQESKDALDLAEQFKAYRVKRWGETKFEANEKASTTISIYSLRSCRCYRESGCPSESCRDFAECSSKSMPQRGVE